MLTRSSWIKIAAIVVLGICICTGIASCSFGCTPLVRGCTAMPGVPAWNAQDYPNVGNASIQASQVRNIELDWFEGRVEFNIVDDGVGEAVAVGQQNHDGDAHGDGHEAREHDATHDGVAAVAADAMAASNATDNATANASAASNASEIRLEESTGGRSLDDSGRLRWALDGDTLRVVYWESSSALSGCNGFNWPSKTLVVTIPKSACEHLGTVSLNAFSGDYNLDGLSCETLEVDLASGRVDGSGTAFDRVDIEVASGMFNLEAQIADKLDLEMASGNANITCSGSAPRTMDMSMASGNATLTMPADAGITANVNKLSGLFNFDMPDSHTYDDNFICGDGSSRLNVDMSSGNVTVRS